MELGPEVDTVAGPADAANLPPHQRLLLFVEGKRVAQMIYVLAALEIADLLAPGPRSAADLAGEVGADADALYRILRCTATVGVFAQLPDGRFTLTPMADALRKDSPDSRRELVLAGGHEALWRPPGEILGEVLGVPGRSQELGVVRERLLSAPDPLPDLSGFGTVTSLSGERDEEITPGSPAYLLSGVLRHRDDESAAAILGRIRKAIGGARLLLWEFVLSGPNSWDRRKFLDIEMMVALGGRERELPEWQRLVGVSGFTLAGRPRQGRWTILECVPSDG